MYDHHLSDMVMTEDNGDEGNSSSQRGCRHGGPMPDQPALVRDGVWRASRASSPRLSVHRLPSVSIAVTALQPLNRNHHGVAGVDRPVICDVRNRWSRTNAKHFPPSRQSEPLRWQPSRQAAKAARFSALPTLPSHGRAAELMNLACWSVAVHRL